MKREQGLPAFGGAKGDQGFTMIELLITVVIFSILLGIAIPAFSKWLPNYRLRGAARELYSNLQLAKTGAIRDRVEWAVRFTGTGTYEVWSALDSTSPNTNRQWDSADPVKDTLIKTVNISDYGSGVAFGAGNATSSAIAGGGPITPVPATPIRFNARGFATNNAETYAYITNRIGTAYAVGILASGVVVLRKWNNGQWE